jgi:hypothetical protein
MVDDRSINVEMSLEHRLSTIVDKSSGLNYLGRQRPRGRESNAFSNELKKGRLFPILMAYLYTTDFENKKHQYEKHLTVNI